MAAAAVLNPVKEGRFLLPGNDRRPADIFLPNWAEGRDAALDVTVINPLQQATVVEAATTPGHLSPLLTSDEGILYLSVKIMAKVEANEGLE